MLGELREAVADVAAAHSSILQIRVVDDAKLQTKLRRWVGRQAQASDAEGTAALSTRERVERAAGADRTLT